MVTNGNANIVHIQKQDYIQKQELKKLKNEHSTPCECEQKASLSQNKLTIYITNQTF